MIKEELFQRYGPTMSVPNIAEVFHTSKGTLYNKLSKGTFPIPMFQLGGRKLVAETADVAKYLEESKLLPR